MNYLNSMLNDLVFVGTNYAMRAGLIKDKHQRRAIASKLSRRGGYTYRTTVILKLMPKLVA